MMGEKHFSRIAPILMLGMGLSACNAINDSFANLDLDLRGTAGGLDTSSVARQATVDRPQPDSRGVISYPNYQVAVARRNDTIIDIASRVGGDPNEIARLNGLSLSDQLVSGEVVALPTSVPVPAAVDRTGRPIDISQIATTAIDDAPVRTAAAGGGIATATPSRRIDGPEPIRHQVAAGETAFSIARLYNISVRSLSDWNGLGPDLDVREGQFLLIPVTSATEAATEVAATPAVSRPGFGSVEATPLPPSASQPLPQENIEPLRPAVQTAAAPSTLIQPVSGQILRPYKKRTNEGIDIAAAAGTAVKAAGGGEVAAITRDTEQVPILVLRHPNNLLTVYANITDIKVKKGDQIQRGQTIATVGNGDPAFLHFEVREGFESVDPAKYLN